MSIEIHPEVVDRLMELYCDWRTACWDVRSAYERFLEAGASDRAVAFAAYTAELDQEESACEAYAAHIHAIQSRYPGAGAQARRAHATFL
jgi:hypothetical protein